MFALLLALSSYLAHTIYEAARAEQEFRDTIKLED